MKPKIVVLSTGGTIVSSGASETQLTGYSIKGLSVEDVIAAVPSLSSVADIDTHSVCNIPSSCITSQIWIELAREIELLCRRSDVNGIVITHGTDTMEETAFFLNLVLKTEKPVVLTGAMRPATALSADGPLNLLNAVRVAASPQSVGKGVLVVLNGIINSARDVTKSNTTSVETFKGRDFGSLGYVIENKVEYFAQSIRPHTVTSEFSLEDFHEKLLLPKVLLVMTHADDDDLSINAAVDAKYLGIVVAACGHGTLSKIVEEALVKAAQVGCVVVRSSRTGSGPVLNGLERWQKAGFISAGSLSPQKARILLQLALNKCGNSLQEINRIFENY